MEWPYGLSIIVQQAPHKCGWGNEMAPATKNSAPQQIKWADSKLQLLHYRLAISTWIDPYCNQEQRQVKESGEEAEMMLILF